MIQVPKAAIDLAKRFEGFERKAKRGIEITAIPYICPAGFWTIGYGHLCDPTHPPITEAEAEAYLARDLQTALVATLRYCPVLATEPEGRLAAIVDFTFNLGAGRLQTSTLRRRINQRDWAAVSRELGRWVYGGGRILAGLVDRRTAEAALVTQPEYLTPNASLNRPDLVKLISISAASSRLPQANNALPQQAFKVRELT